MVAHIFIVVFYRQVKQSELELIFVAAKQSKFLEVRVIFESYLLTSLLHKSDLE